MCATNIWNTWSTDFKLDDLALSTTKVFTKAFCEWSEIVQVGGKGEGMGVGREGGREWFEFSDDESGSESDIVEEEELQAGEDRRCT